MRIAPISPISAAIQAQALAAVEGALTAGLTDNAAIEAAAKVHLGAQAAQTALVADTPDTPPSPSAPVDPARAAVDQAKGAAAASQASLAPMFADMAAALNAPSTPPQLRTALANVLSLRTPVGANFTGPQLQQAVAQSGVMLEAKLAAGTPPGRDLKAALLTLLQTLKALPAPPPSAAPAAPIRPLAQHAGLDPTTAEPPPTVPDPIHSAARPPPPLRDAPLRPQPAETSALPLMREGEVAPRLAAEVEHAVARQVLHQIASLPQGPDGPAWMFELPLLTPQGATLAQFAIQRDDREGGGGASAEEGGPAWRARFALDVDPLGPVQVDLRLGGAHRSHVTLWGGETAMTQLAQDSEMLGRLLDADVALRPGQPAEGPPAAPGQFVDRTS